MDGSRDYEQENQSISSELVNVLKIGIYLSLMSVALLFTLIIYDTSIEIQQVAVVVIGLLLLASFTAFKKVISFDHKSSLSDQYIPYFDNRIITSNTVYNGHTYYNNKQNLADAAEEIQNLLNKPMMSHLLTNQLLMLTCYKKLKKLKLKTTKNLLTKKKL
jgi:hypothetical protein